MQPGPRDGHLEKIPTVRWGQVNPLKCQESLWKIADDLYSEFALNAVGLQDFSYEEKVTQ